MRRGRDDGRIGTAARVDGARGLCCLLLAFALPGCSQFDVKASRDPNADFGRLRTYAWLPPREAEPADQRVLDRAIDRRIREATDAELQAKGYRPADSGPADFLLNYRLTTSPDDSLHGRGASGLWGGWPGAYGVYETYDVGTLYVAVLDGTTRHMIWVGAARARLLPQASDERRAKRVDAAVKQIFASFPRR